MIFLSLIMDLLLAAFGMGGATIDAQTANHHFGTEGARKAHTIHGHVSTEHHGVHGHTAGPSGHANQNPHGTTVGGV